MTLDRRRQPPGHRRSWIALALLAACARAPVTESPPVPAASALTPHLSSAEQQRLAIIQKIHEPGLGLIQRLRESGRVATDVQWWVAGDSAVLPFAGDSIVRVRNFYDTAAYVRAVKPDP